MQLVVGRIAKAHGVTGEVAVEVRTDDPDHRYTPGATLDTDPAERGPLTVERARWHSGRLLIRFAGVADRSAAEHLRGTLLVADSTTSQQHTDEDDYWDHDLVGLEVVTADGQAVGAVTDVLHPPGPAVLVVERADRPAAMIPFVRALVPTVDLAAGRVIVDLPDGLLEL
jgi:16S rRNA processing protein RimM